MSHIQVGDRVELSPGYDLWARGERFGVIRSIEGEVAVVKMDHPQVKKLQRIPVVDLRRPGGEYGTRGNPHYYDEEQAEDEAKAQRLREISEKAMAGRLNPRLNPHKLAVGRVLHGRHGSVMVVQDEAGFDVVVVKGDQAWIQATTPSRGDALRVAVEIHQELSG